MAEEDDDQTEELDRPPDDEGSAAPTDEWARFRTAQAPAAAAAPADEWAAFRTAPAAPTDEWAAFRTQPKQPEAESPFWTAIRHAAHSVLPSAATVAGGLAGAGYGAELGAPFGPVGVAAGGLGGGVIGGLAAFAGARTVQEEGLKAIGFDDSHAMAAGAKLNPKSALAGDIAGALPFFGVGAAPALVRAGGAALGAGMEAYGQYSAGEDPDWMRIVGAAGAGAIMTKPTSLAESIGTRTARALGRPEFWHGAAAEQPPPPPAGTEPPVQGQFPWGAERQIDLPLEPPAPPPIRGQRELPLEPDPALDRQGQYGFPWRPGEAEPGARAIPHGSPGAEAAAGTAEAKPAPTEAGGAPQPTNTNNYGKAEPKPAGEEAAGGVNIGSDPTIEAALRAKMQPEGPPPETAAGGTVRFYHGGEDPTSGGPRWVTPDESYARNFRAHGTPNEVHYVDIPRERLQSDLAAGYDDVNGYYRHFEAPEDIAKQLKPLAAAAPEPPSAPAAQERAAPPAPAAPPKFSIAKDAETGRHVLFRDDEAIGDFANRGAALKARNLAVIKDTAARRQQAAPAAPETLQRRPIVRDLTGRPIETARMPIGTERAILEQGYARATGPRPPPGVEQPPLMQAARRQGPAEPEGAARGPPPQERLSISAGKDPETGKPAQLLMRGENVVGAYPSYSEARQALNRMQAAAAPKAGAGAPSRPPGHAAGAGGAGTPPRPPTVGQAATAGAGRTPPPGAPPSLPQNRSVLSNLARSIKLLVGADIGPLGREAEHVIRGAYGDAQRAFEQTINLLNPHQETVRPMSEMDRRAMMNRIEGGNRFPNWQPTPEQQSLIDVHKKAMDVWKDQLGKLDRTAQMKFIDDYAAHMYQNPAQAREFFSQYGKRGGAGSTKARTHATYEDAIDAGLKPLSDNPVEIATRYGLSMKNFIASNDALERGVRTGVVGYFTSGKNVGATGSPEPQQVGGPPPGWKKLDAPPKGPFLEAYAPEDFADKYNTFYGKGLRGQHAPIYDALRNANGAWTQLELGLNAYHFFTMANEAIISDAAKGLSQMMSGQLGKGALAIARAPLAPVIRAIEGKRFQQEYLNPNSTNPIASIMAEANARPIGRGHAYDILGSAGDEKVSRGSFVKNFSANKINSEFKQAWNDIKQDWGLADTVGKQALFPFKQASRALQTVGAPLFDKYIPALKAGALHSQMEAWLEANPHIDISTPDGRRAAVDAAKKISDSVDNRFGEMVHDNLFMNQTLRQSAVVSMRSFSWAMGAMREIAGGTYAAGKAGALSLKTGENRFSMAHPEYDPRISYAIAFPFVVATISSIYQYLRAGEAPKDWRDLYAPRTGGTIPGLGGKGQVQEHALMPGFQKDVYGWLAHPGREAYAKLGGLPTTALEQLTNQDWRGDPITKHGANPLDQFQQRMAHLFSKLGPIGIRSMVKGQPATSGITPVETALGFRAPGVDIQDPERLENWLKANAGKQWKTKERHEKTEQRKYGRERAYDPREREQQPQ